jgi:hypothetical protein
MIKKVAICLAVIIIMTSCSTSSAKQEGYFSVKQHFIRRIL